MGATTAPNPRLALTIAIAPYLLWVAATYLLEGRLLTFQRPEAPLSRLAHAVVTNILVGLGGSVIIESVLFGACHFAHSSPFNTARFVVLLGTLFFFVSRDVYGTIVFYNFLGIFGVGGALEPPSTLGSFEQRAIPLLAMAVVAVVRLHGTARISYSRCCLKEIFSGTGLLMLRLLGKPVSRLLA